MDVGFIMTYIIIPIVIGIGVLSGRKHNTKLRVGIAFGMKGIFYLYCAVANIYHYIDNDWTDRYVIGLTVALAIMEGLTGISDSIERVKEYYMEN